MLSLAARETEDGILFTDPQRRILWANDGFVRITGYSQAELVGKTPGTLLQGKGTDPFASEEMGRAVEERREFEVEILNYRKDGTPIWLFIQGKPIFDQDGELKFYMAVERDVTEQRRALKELERERTFLRRMSEVAKIGAWNLDLKTDAVWWSDQTYDLHGVPRGEPISIEKAIHFYDGEEAQETVRRALDQAIHEGKEFDVVLPLSSSKGERIWGRAIGYAELKEEKPFRVFGCFQDVTQQVESESKREELRERLELATRSRKLGIWDFDAASQILSLDNTMFEMTGINESSFQGTLLEWKGAIHPEDQERVEAAAWKAIRSGSEFSEVFRFQSESSERPVHVRAHALSYLDEEGEPGRLVGVCHDISDEVSGEEERRMLEQQLFQSQKLEALGTLAGGIAHDFNNMLGVVMGNLELIELESGDPEAVKEHVELASKGCSRAKEVVAQLLTFSRRQEDGPSAETDLCDGVREALKLLRVGLSSTVTLIEKLPEKSLYVRGSAAEINQIILNLVTNAHHAIGDETGTIEVLVREKEFRQNSHFGADELPAGRYVELSVQDDGGGISEESLPNIFDPFYSTKEVGEGSGLGLSVVHGIVKRFGGAITVESLEGKGAHFSIYLPVSQHVENILEAIPLIGDNLRGKRVLLIDDDELIRNTLTLSLQNAGCKLAVAGSANEGIEIIEKGLSFDLVLCDLSMPVKTGKGFAQELERREIDIPVMLMTGNLRLAGEDQPANVKALIGKPFTLDQLRKSVQSIFGGESGEQ